MTTEHADAPSPGAREGELSYPCGNTEPCDQKLEWWHVTLLHVMSYESYVMCGSGSEPPQSQSDPVHH